MKSTKKKMKKSVSEEETINDIFFISTKPGEDVKSDDDNDDEEEKPEATSIPMTNKYQESKEKNLERFLFGKSVKKEVKEEIESSSDSSDEDEPESRSKSRKRKPAWKDEDDVELKVKDVVASFQRANGKHGQKETSEENYAEFLRKKFTSFVDTPKWADLDHQKEEGDSDDEFFRETTDMLETGKQESLKKGHIECRKLKDVNFQTHNEGAVIKSCEFHPSATVGLVAGLSGTASLFQIDGKLNPKIQTVNFENFPIKTAHFTADGQKFIAGSQHFGHFFVYDMYKGKIIKVPWKEDKEQTNMQRFEVSPNNDLIAFHGRFGTIHLVSAKSFTKVFSLKMNDNVTSVAFSPDGEKLYSHGAGGEVYIWDLKAQDCLHRFFDDGCIRGTAIDISKNNKFVATGSDSGVVNVYKRGDLLNSNRPKPEKIVLNMTTSISNVKFNPTSEILAMTSEVQDNSVRLLHTPSMSVFKNFPSSIFNLKRINCMDFSANGGYFSIGNNKGAANLFRLKHFGNF